ncbi:MAG: glycosyltransferase family 4 protein [Prochlorococcaceae cyanobacterium]
MSTFYDLQVQAYPDFFPAAAREERLDHFRQMLAKASRIAAISHFSREEAVAAGGDPGRIRAIPIRMARSRKGELMDHPPLNLEKNRFFLYPANLWRHKNHELLLSAFAMARHQGLSHSLTLVCTGDGVNRLGELRQLAERLGLGQSVLLPGFLSDADLEGLYQHALAVVFPSLYEGFGMPVLEAMARGLPVACSSTTALGEVAGDAALCFHPGHPQQIADALRRLADDPGLCQKLILRGQRQAEDYARTDVMVEQYWQLLEEAHAGGAVA